MPEAYIRGNTIKYLRVPDEVIDKVRDDSYNRAGNTGYQKLEKRCKFYHIWHTSSSCLNQQSA